MHHASDIIFIISHADTFGSTATAIVLTRIARPDESNNEAFRFRALREYALRHPEAGLIRYWR
ncbi:antirestriction protein [Xenorhabdus sp. DI]|uniref:antirestriction protein n=1 Tax=Xenorhabdus doucetiae TaxID=351671 RepID=UPI00199B30D2|nr:antirestriction protein [Xenorhabdus sp. 3]MBD2789617.1 antirestriction protein [Xenorhabdus sp. DI]